MPSSASSPSERSLATGTGGGRRLAKTIDSRSGPRATISRAIRRMSATSSARWKSSRMSAAPSVAIAGSSSRKVSIASSRVGPPGSRERRMPAVRGANSGSNSRPAETRWARKPDPVAILLVDPVPDRSKPGAPREVGQESRLAVAGVGDDEHDPAVDLDVEPVEQPHPRQRLVAERRCLDLSRLDRIRHAVPRLDADAIGCRIHRTSRADRDRHPRGRPPPWTERDWIGRRERYGRRSATVNDADRGLVGHGRHGADRCSPGAYLDPRSWSSAGNRATDYSVSSTSSGRRMNV